MWLGTRNFAFLRITVFHIAFIWLSSLSLPRLVNHPRITARWARWLRLLVNYFNKVFYQQLLFFVVPIYYASATFWSRNICFVLLLGFSAFLSTQDILYDRYLSAKRALTAIFFSFNLLACINVMLPVLWGVANTRALRISGLLAWLGFVTLYYRGRGLGPRPRTLIVLVGFFLLALVELGRPFVPPAPLRLVKVEFGRGLHKESLQITSPLRELPPAASVQIYGLTAIRAPLGLREKVRHRWYRNSKPVYVSASYLVTGGRKEGFRFYTKSSFEDVRPGTIVQLDLETEGGQLIGRARLRVGT